MLYVNDKGSIISCILIIFVQFEAQSGSMYQPVTVARGKFAPNIGTQALLFQVWLNLFRPISEERTR